MLIALGVVAVMGLALTAYTTYLGYDYSNRRAAYDGAKPCASPADISRCRYQGDARIVRKSLSGADPRVELTFVQLPGVDLTAYLDRSYRSHWDSWQESSVVEAEVWQGKVTTVASLPTLESPDVLPSVGAAPALFFGTATLVLAASFFWFLFSWLARREAAPS
jgi:hypothetical protein